MKRETVIVLIISIGLLVGAYLLFSSTSTDKHIAQQLNKANIPPTPSTIQQVKDALALGIPIVSTISGLISGGGAVVAGGVPVTAAAAGEVAPGAVASTSGGTLVGAGTLATIGSVVAIAAVAYWLWSGLADVFNWGDKTNDVRFVGAEEGGALQLDRNWAVLLYLIASTPDNDSKAGWPYPNEYTNHDLLQMWINEFNRIHPGIVDPVTWRLLTDYKPTVTFYWDGVSIRPNIISIVNNSGGYEGSTDYQIQTQ